MARDPGPRLPEGEPLLTRLLRRRADAPAADPDPVSAPDPAVSESEAVSPANRSDPADTDAATSAGPGEAPPSTRIDPRSGKPIDELVDADLPPVDSIGPDSDVRAFLGRNISPELRRQALRKLFHQPKFNVVCLCAEYAENYNNFTPMGAIVPHDLKRQLALQAERLARRALEEEALATSATPTGHDRAGAGAQTMLQRDAGEASTKVLSDAQADRSEEPQPAADKPHSG